MPRSVPTPLEPTRVAVSVDSCWTAPTATPVYVSAQVGYGKVLDSIILYLQAIYSQQGRRDTPLQSCFIIEKKQPFISSC